jgi:hypothetical protein
VLTAVLLDLVPFDPETSVHLRVRQAFLAMGLHDEAIAEQLRATYHHLHHTDLGDLLRRDQQADRLPATIDPWRLPPPWSRSPKASPTTS